MSTLLGSQCWRVRPASSARSVTRVESPTPSKSDSVSSNKTKIDWLNCTFDGSGFTPTEFGQVIQQFFRVPVQGEHRAGEGFLGFSEGWKLIARLPDGSTAQVGVIARGGKSQRGRWLFQINGRGCGLVSDWARLSEFLSTLIDLRVSRVDIAADFLNGEFTVDDAVTLYDEGRFISRGRNPEIDLTGGWYCKNDEEQKKGRTVYIGKLKNGKTLCVYEKGKQLKMENSDWVRYEVRLGNRDRETIPLEVLTNPDKFFRGAYPAIADMLEGAAQEIPTVARETQASLAHGLYHASRCYGKYFNQVLNATDCDISDLIEEVRITGLPAKIDPIGVINGISWNDLKREINQYRGVYI